MRKPITRYDPRFNPLRHILRDAMNMTKMLEWNEDPQIAYTSLWQWDKLQRIFERLGPFCEIVTHYGDTT